MADQVGIALPQMLRTTTEAGPAQVAYEQAVEAFFGTGRAFAFWKGRIALYTILKSLGIGPGDEIIVPGYTCVMVPGPVIYTGATSTRTATAFTRTKWRGRSPRAPGPFSCSTPTACPAQ